MKALYTPVPEGGFATRSAWAQTNTVDGKVVEQIMLRRRVSDGEDWIADDIKVVDQIELFKTFWPDLPLDD